jgi:predicted DNA-binding protein (UPF0278 family)
MILDFTEQEKSAFILELALENNLRLQRILDILSNVLTDTADLKNLATVPSTMTYEQVERLKKQLEQNNKVSRDGLVVAHDKELEKNKDILRERLREIVKLIRKQM